MAVSTCARRLSRRLGTGLFVLLVAGTAHAAPDLAVTDVEFWSLDGSTRVSIQLSGAFRHTDGRLSKPERLFFDIPNSRPAMVAKGEYKVAVADAQLKQIRVAETKPGITRIVFDLEEGVEFTASHLSNPDRLMVELRSKKAPAKAPAKTADTPVKTPPVATKSEAPAAAPPPKFAPLEPARPAPPPEVTPAPQSVTKVEPMVPATAPATAPAVAVVAAVTAPAVIPPQAPTRNSNGDRSLTRVLGLKAGRIVIDPGHGGHDPGTHGKSGLIEKDLVLDISKRLAKMLENNSGFEVVLTRSDDSFIALEDRTAIANNAKADLFLSIHANSNPSRSIAGIETYYLNFSASREDLDLATRENATARSTIGDLREVVSKIALRAKLDESREFAVQLHNTLNAAAKSQNKEAKERPVKKAPFVVLIGSEMPSVLAEIGYLSNAREEELFKDDAYRDRVAQALFDGIAAYMKTLGQGERAALE